MQPIPGDNGENNSNDVAMFYMRQNVNVPSQQTKHTQHKLAS